MNKYLRTDYREQLEMYPSLTQEEIEELYAREGIQDKPISEVIKELEDEIHLLKSSRDNSIKGIQETIYERQKDKYSDITASITALEKKKDELKRIQSELQELMGDVDASAGMLSSISAIDNKIEILKKEWRRLTLEKQELTDKKDEIYRETKIKIASIEEKLSKIKVDYASVFKQLYSSSRGLIRRKRKFPSSELRNEIVVGHLGLARSLAARYYIMCDKKIEFDDLHQIAYEALISAAHYYVPSSRAKFKTYARRCIENKLKRSIGEMKKEKSKRTTKPLEFIDEELRRIDYVLMLIDACRNVRGKDGNKYFSNHFDLNPIGIQSRFKESIRFYNRELRSLGLTKEQLPTFKVKKSEVGFQEILKIALNYMKYSKMKVLISSEDIEVASLVVAYENHNHDLHEIYELLYTLELYQKRLRDVKLLLEVEIELANNSDGIRPSEEELLEGINRRIASENKGIYKAKRNSAIANYKSLYSYNDLYYDMWGVDFLAQGEYANNRATEIRDIEYHFEEMQNSILYYYQSLIDDINDYLEDEVHLYKHCDDNDKYPSVLEAWDNDSFEALEERVFTKEQAITFVRELIEKLESITKKDYVDRVLKWRKKVTLDELNRLNAEVIEKNKTMEETIRQQRAAHYVRYWTMDNIQSASLWLNALYESGLSTISSNQLRTVRQIPSVEDEVIGNLFMTDYISALESLPPLSKEILSLYYDENGAHSTKASEIAKKLGITEKAVYREKSKALILLRKNETLKSYLE